MRLSRQILSPEPRGDIWRRVGQSSGAKNAKKGPRMDAKGNKPFNRRCRYEDMRFPLASGMSHDEIL